MELFSTRDDEKRERRKEGIKRNVRRDEIIHLIKRITRTEHINKDCEHIKSFFNHFFNMKFLPSTIFFATVVVPATVLSPSFVQATEDSNLLMGNVGRDEPNIELLWKPSQEKEHGSFTDVDTISRCFDEKYELKLVVHAHVHPFFVSIPMDDETKCPSLLLHADFVDPMTKDTMEKTVHAIIDSKVLEHDMALVETISIGNYSLKEIADAFHNADDGNDKPYDSVTNNCGILLINMAKYLGVDYYSNLQLIGYVQRRILNENGPNMMMGRRLARTHGDGDSDICF